VDNKEEYRKWRVVRVLYRNNQGWLGIEGIGRFLTTCLIDNGVLIMSIIMKVFIVNMLIVESCILIL